MKTIQGNTIRTLLIVAIWTISTNLFAQGQGGGNKEDKIEALRIAWISEQLNLTPEEAQKFWPVYNAYRSDLQTLKKNFKPGEGQLSAEEQLDFEQKKLDLKKKYKMQFEGALGKGKLNQLYGLEEKFHQKLKELREERQQNRGNNPPGRRPWGPR